MAAHPGPEVTPAEARAALLRHAGWAGDVGDGLLAWLRPYQGVRDDHLLEILHALVVLAPEWQAGPLVGRETVGAVWDLCSRAVGLTEETTSEFPHRLRGLRCRRGFIPAEDKQKLDDWVGWFERFAVGALGRRPVHAHDWALLHRHGFAARAPFVVPHVVASMADTLALDERGEWAGDELAELCDLLAAVGPAAHAATDTLARLAANPRFPSCHAAATRALAAVRAV